MERLILTSLSTQELQDLFQQTVQTLVAQFSVRDTPPNQELLAVPEACDLLKVAKPTLYNLVHRKAIPHMKRGRRLYFSYRELLAWVAQGRKQTQEEIQAQAAHFIEQQTSKQR